MVNRYFRGPCRPETFAGSTRKTDVFAPDCRRQLCPNLLIKINFLIWHGGCNPSRQATGLGELVAACGKTGLGRAATLPNPGELPIAECTSGRTITPGRARARVGRCRQ